MRASLTFSSFLALSLFGLACGAPPTGADGATVSAADTTPSFPQLCLVPQEHPRNGDGPIFTLTEALLQRAALFYWHGEATTLGAGEDPPIRPSETWKVDSVVVTDTSVHLGGLELIPQIDRAKSFVLELARPHTDPARAWWEQADMTGTLTVRDHAHPDQADEVVAIVSSEQCQNLP
jgi:hypothetical protein